MIFDTLSSWWKLLWRRRRFRRVMVVESMTAVPERLGANIYLVRRGGMDRRVVLACPCKCGRKIDLNLVSSSHQASWSATFENGKLSLQPSVWLRSDPCHSHFFIRNSRVHWV